MPFIRRILAQALLHGASSDTAFEARELSAKVGITLPTEYDHIAVDALGPSEMCPACHTPVPFHELSTAVCPNGHIWGRHPHYLIFFIPSS